VLDIKLGTRSGLTKTQALRQKHRGREGERLGIKTKAKKKIKKEDLQEKRGNCCEQAAAEGLQRTGTQSLEEGRTGRNKVKNEPSKKRLPENKEGIHQATARNKNRYKQKEK